MRQRDGALRYSQFSQALQTTSSPSMVQGTLDQLPQLESWTIQSVRTGLSGNSSVEVLLKSENGSREATLVINPQGRLVAQLFNVSDKDSTKVARAFIDAVSDGQFISARSLLALDLQKEISPQAAAEQVAEAAKDHRQFPSDREGDGSRARAQWLPGARHRAL